MATAFHSQLPFAAERYVLNELSDEEKLLFEEHFFSCETCAQEVEDLTSIRLALPGELRTLDRKPAKWALGSWMPWILPNRFAFSALALVIVFAGYQNLVQIPHLKAEADDIFAVTAAPSSLSAKRAADVNVIDGKLRAAPLLIANEWTENYRGYEAKLSRHGSAAVLFDKELARTAETLLVTIPAHRIGPGQFDLIISGKPAEGSPQVVGRYVVTVQGE